MAYDKLDKNGDGTVTLDDIKMAYDVSFHPDVSLIYLNTLIITYLTIIYSQFGRKSAD